MLGDKIGEDSGKITSQKVLPPDGANPQFEATYQGSGKMLGVDVTVMITYSSVVMPDGTLHGEGRGVLLTPTGGRVNFKGEGIGRFTGHGPNAVSWRGNQYYVTASGPLERLNSVVAVFEYEIDNDGNVKGTIWEWK
jgi:hypothetical protein